jgi:hypothetical protein
MLLKESRIRLIALEMLFVPLYENQAQADAVMARLREVGYHLYDWYNFSYHENGQLLFGDAIFLPAQTMARVLPPAQPLGGPEAANGEEERAENERLRATIAHLKRRIDRYKSKLQGRRHGVQRSDAAG